ncbi:unnamed protein product [Brassica rapa]|uniref:Uncharacterized protein n=2 Tax=Brassica TaxID=3705 RepID=A0A8D9D7P9_BRACM|nr:unnamed protein product [Brassica napus]CAG7869553.1 unnamed protein product [Brassica rapa]
MIIYVSEVYWREGKVNKTKALILSPLKKKMSEKKLVFVSIASPNNLTPTSEKQACTLLWRVPYYGLNAWKTVEADMSGSIGLKPEQ